MKNLQNAISVLLLFSAFAIDSSTGDDSVTTPTPTRKGGGNKTTDRELQIEFLKSADNCETKSQIGDALAVKYTGTFQNGTVFYTSGDKPFEFNLGAGQVIEGWEKGLLNMCEGEKRKLVIPPELGYGSEDYETIPGNSVLIYEIELVSITRGSATTVAPEYATVAAENAQ